jgi:hypothetical protein
MPKVGEQLSLSPSGKEVTVLEADGNIVIYDEWLPDHNEWNRLIARFDTNSAGKIEWNKNATIIDEHKP